MLLPRRQASKTKQCLAPGKADLGKGGSGQIQKEKADHGQEQEDEYEHKKHPHRSVNQPAVHRDDGRLLGYKFFLSPPRLRVHIGADLLYWRSVERIMDY